MRLAHAVRLFAVFALGHTQPPTLDIIQIDTGNMDNFSGVLSMPSNCYPCWHRHGTQMAHALNDEAIRQTRMEMRAQQLIWRTSHDVPKRIREAVRLKPKVISLALAGDGHSSDEYNALVAASEAGILVLAAAGNQAKSAPQYPGAYRLPCLLAVSTQIHGTKDPVANSGDVYYQKMWPENGTSYSTARLAAVAVAYYQKHPYATCEDAERHLREQFSLHTRF